MIIIYESKHNASFYTFTGKTFRKKC